MNDYQRVAKAIDYMRHHARSQPTLEQIADAVHLSPWHLQRLFSRWAGVSPKRFLQALTVEDAKARLRERPAPLMQIAAEVGLNGAASLHDHFVTLDAVTPDEYRKLGQGLCIEAGCHDTPLGRILIARTERGICHLSFVVDTDENALARLRGEWPGATVKDCPDATRAQAQQLFNPDLSISSRPVSLWVKGTNFQISVWRALLGSQHGELTSYQTVATQIGKPRAVRAVGTAVGANPVALLIPCHRVIRADGGLGGYRWGETRKCALLALESNRA